MSETRKLAAILVADIVGYSRLAGADEDRILARLRTLRSDLIDPILAVHHGRVVKRTGDGAIIEFRSVVDAVLCAIEVQSGLAERNAGLPPEKRIEYRVGIHLGEVVEEADGDLMGDGVNIAARLEGVAQPGTICLSEQAYWQVKGRLDLKVTDLGATQLKNIAEPIRVYSLQVGVPAQAKPVTVQAPEKSASPHLSIVVLPFKNLSGDPAQDYFADGVTENLTTDLSRIRNSFVIARNTAFTFKGKAVDAKQIAKELGVRYVLEGSVQRDQNRVRVNAQLIDGETGAHLWADRFEEDVADLFKLQDQIVARLAISLRYALTSAEAEKGARSNNPDVVDLTMQGWNLLSPLNDDCGSVKKARGLFDRALQIDPNDANALAGSAQTYVLDSIYGWGEPGTDYQAKVLGQANLAIALFAGNVRAYLAKSLYLSLPAHQFDEALGVADAGLAVNPNYVSLYTPRAVAENALGRYEQAKADMERAMRLSPHDTFIPIWRAIIGDAEMGLGRFDAAIVQYRKAIDSGFRAGRAYAALAAAYAHAGKMDEAKTTLAEARRLNPAITVKWMKEHAPNLSAVFDGLRKAGLPEE
jgi:adenylate cyclase